MKKTEQKNVNLNKKNLLRKLQEDTLLDHFSGHSKNDRLFYEPGDILIIALHQYRMPVNLQAYHLPKPLYL